jgi:hypothetical protein
MPNVLLTFEEVADLFHCDAAAARSLVIENQWERRRWVDGLPRVQVPPEVAHQFMLNYAAKFEQHLPPARECDAATIPGPAASGGAIECGTALAEQAPGLEPVDRTLAQMDAISDPNRATMKTNVARAKNLDDQAKAMNNQVGFFRFNDQRSRPAVAQKAAAMARRSAAAA